MDDTCHRWSSLQYEKAVNDNFLNNDERTVCDLAVNAFYVYDLQGVFTFASCNFSVT